MVDSVSVRFKNASVSKKMFFLNIRIQWNAGTACVSECVLKTLACRGLRVGPSKVPRIALCHANTLVALLLMLGPKMARIEVCKIIAQQMGAKTGSGGFLQIIGHLRISVKMSL